MKACSREIMKKSLLPGSFSTRSLMPLVVFLSALFIAPTQAQFQWAERVASAGGSPPNHGPIFGATLDAYDNSYITGWFDGTNNFAGVTLTNQSVGGADIFVAKYNSIGALQWVERAGGTSFNFGRGVGVDTNGNAYVTGGVYGPANFGTNLLPASSYVNFFLAKYNSAGGVQWVRQSAAGYDVNGNGLAVDGVGNSYAMVELDGVTPVTLGTNTLSIPSGYGDSTVLAKYDSTGALQWAQLLGALNTGGYNQVVGSGVAVDALGNVYACGTFVSALAIGNTTLMASGGGKNLFLAKFTNSGALVWATNSTGGNPNGGGVAVDPAGNPYVCCSYANTISFGAVSLTNGGAFVAKYNGSGAAQWAVQAGGPGGGGPNDVGDYVNIAFDGQGNIFAAGILSNYAAISKYSPTGVFQWTQSASGPPASSFASMAGCAVDPVGHCYVAGLYQGTAALGTNVLQPQETWNFFLAEVASRPQLAIVRSGGNVILTWPTNSSGFVLQSNANLSTATWGTVLPVPLVVNGQNTVTNSISGARRSYRLVQ